MDNTEHGTMPSSKTANTIGPLISIDSTVVDSMAELIDEYFRGQNKTKYKLNKYSIIEIDEVKVDAYIKIYHPNENNSEAEYALTILSQNVRTGRDESFVIYNSYDHKTIREVLDLLVKINNEYVFLDHFLLSPYELKHAKMQRKIFPLSEDYICSVCSETTVEHTLCNHPICYKCRELCISKGKTFNCPICRSNCLHIVCPD
jgi:hypothetical protein